MFVLIYIVLVCTFAYRVGRVLVEIYLLQKTAPLDSSHPLSASFTNIPSQVMRIIRCEGIYLATELDIIVERRQNERACKQAFQLSIGPCVSSVEDPSAINEDVDGQQVGRLS